jgi:hypothetical protein
MPRPSPDPPNQTDAVETEGLIIAALAVNVHQFGSDGRESIIDIDRETVAEQGVAAFFVNRFALDVHHVIVFEQTLANPEVVFFYLFSERVRWNSSP